jgi:hypothetical protein
VCIGACCELCDRKVSLGQRGGSQRPQSRFSRPDQLLFLSSSPLIVLDEAEWTGYTGGNASASVALDTKDQGR